MCVVSLCIEHNENEETFTRNFFIHANRINFTEYPFQTRCLIEIKLKDKLTKQ